MQHLEDGGDFECIAKNMPDAEITTFHLKVHEMCEFPSKNCSMSINPLENEHNDHSNTTDEHNITIASSTDNYGMDQVTAEATEATDTTEANKFSFSGAGKFFNGVLLIKIMVSVD